MSYRPLRVQQDLEGFNHVALTARQPTGAEMIALQPVDEENLEYKRKSRRDDYICVGLVLLSLVLLWGIIIALMQNRDSLTRLLPSNPADQVKVYQDYLASKKVMTFEDFVHGKFRSNLQSYQFDESKGGCAYLTYNSDGMIVRRYLNSSAEEVLTRKDKLVEPKTGMTLNVEDFSLSEDGKYLMVSANSLKRWRHSSFSNYFVYSLQKHEMIPVTPGGVPSLLSKFRPKSNDFLYVTASQNLRFVHMNEDGNLVDFEITKTNDLTIFNGVSDWVYEEELFSSASAAWFSKDGSYLAFVQFNDSAIGQYDLQKHLDISGPKPYPSTERLTYPKVGTPNPAVTLFVVKLDKMIEAHSRGEKYVTDDFIVKLKLDEFPDGHQLLIREVTWANNGMLIVRTSNRVQDHQRITVFDVLARETRNGFITGKISRDEHTKGWFDNAFSPVIVLKDNSYLDLIPEGDYLHVARFELFDSMPKSFWTSGEYAITNYAGFDYNKQILYYIATGGNSTQRYVYFVSEKRALRPTKVDAFAQAMDAADDSFTVATLTPDGSFLVINYNGPDFPRQYLLSRPDQKVFKVLNDGSHLAKKLEGYELPKTEIREITFTANDGKQYKAPIQITFPIGFDDSRAHFYPLVVHLYGGPGSQSVSAKWGLGFETMLASSFHEGTVPLYLKEKFHSSNLKEKLQAEAIFNKTKQPPFISLAIDQRGTGMRGLEYMFNVKNHLGENEADDIIRITEAFIKNSSFVDSEKVGFWGWSFGGFLATKIVEKDTKQVFKASVAVAPVIDWKLYDSVYTERYMGLPETNREGYLKSAIFNVSNFNNERYMVIHGTADDNVHFQNTLALLSSLQTYYKPTKDEGVVDVISPNMYSEHFVPDDNHAMGLTFQAYPTVHRLVRDFFTDVFRQIDVFRDLTL